MQSLKNHSISTGGFHYLHESIHPAGPSWALEGGDRALADESRLAPTLVVSREDYGRLREQFMRLT